MSDDTRVPGWVLSPVATVREILGNNRRAAYLGLIALGILWYTGNLPSAGLPSWWPAVAIAGVAMYVGGRWATKRILDLVPEPNGILLVEFDDRELGGGSIYELSPEAFANMRVLGGELHQWDRSPRRVYEVVDYNPEYNVAVANWRESKPGSAIAAERTVDDALAAVRELRQDFETDAAKARETLRRVRGIVRQLDKDRAKAQEEILDEHVAPDLGSSRTVSEVIEEQLPEDLHPMDAPPLEEMDTETKPKTNGDAPDDDSEQIESVEEIDLADLWADTAGIKQ